MNNEFLEQITNRRQILENAKVLLKEKFIGIDDVIDKIIDNISLWYLTPEIQFRPLIVSLWGITGVGKTDLVRSLVKLLNFTDKFIEIQLDMKNEYTKNIETYLENSGINTNEPAILLLDEIQRFRTINEQGQLITDNKHFNDIWMLLSDGRFQNNSERRMQILEMLMEEMYYADMRDAQPKSKDKDDDDEDSKTKEKTRKFQTSYWTANRFKKMLNLKISAEEIMVMSLEDRMKIMEENLKAGHVNEGKSYEKLLIFISGNLDEAFTMADDVEETERDADIYHELSKRINIIHIKNALAKKFKPEQIARFGNNHVIYPCLNRESYYKIIKRNCSKILERIEAEHNIKITLSDNIYDVIYRNGVFPTQGVRPAISTVFNILGNNLPFFMFYALEKDVKSFNVDFTKTMLFSQIGGEMYTKEITLDIDSIRAGKSVDEKMLVAAHEIGHALVYSILFKTPPKQININSAGLENGFVINHYSIDNKTFIRNQLAIYLAGLVAEEIVFGEEYKSNGSSADILRATDIAGKYVRCYGMDGTISRIMRAESQQMSELNYDIDKTNNIIETLLSEEKIHAKDIINKNMKVYKLLLKFAIDNNKIDIDQFVQICNENGLNLITKNINDKLIYSYQDKIKHFLNQ